MSQSTTPDKKGKIFRKSALILPFFAILLAVFYFTRLSLFIYWSPTLHVLFKLVYFPFFIFPGDIADDIYIWSGGMAAVPNPITVPIAVFISLASSYLFARACIYIIEGYTDKKSILTAYAMIIIILVSLGGLFSSVEQKTCMEDKESNVHWTARDNLIVISFDDEYNVERMKFQLFPFYKINKLKYFQSNDNSIIAITEKNEELKTACRLESYYQIFSVWPKSIIEYTEAPFWNKMATELCKQKKYNYDSKDECEKKLLDDARRREDSLHKTDNANHYRLKY